MREKSRNADAVCHRERIGHNKIFDFLQKKLYLGRDTRHKLALIAQEMTGKGFNVHNFDAEKAADALSAFINHMYKDLFSDNKKHYYKPRRPPDSNANDMPDINENICGIVVFIRRL